MADKDPQRQSGRTTRQMLAAPAAAAFIWPNNKLDYPRQLSRHLQREDLNVFPPEDVLRIGDKRATDIVVDHAASLTAEQMRHVKKMNTIAAQRRG